MKYSDDDIKNLCLDIDRIIKFDNTVASLEELKKRLRRKEVNFQDKCEGDHLLGDLLLKYATEDGNLHYAKDFLITNGFKLPQQEQMTAVTNEEEEQKIPNIAGNKAETSSADSSNSGDTQFAMSYDKIKEIVTNNPDITAEEFYEKLKKEVEASTDKERDTKIFDLFADAVRSEASITGNCSVFLKVTKLFAGLDTVIHLKSRASKAILDIAVESKQADVVEILLESGKFDEEEKFNALHLAIIQGNIQEVKPFLGRVSDETVQAALEVAMQSSQEEITEMLLNLITPETPNVNENANPTNTSYKESKENFHTSLRNDVVGVVITGLFITAAVMVPSIAGAVVCGIVAALALIATGLHVKDSTLPNYTAMKENKVELVGPQVVQM